MIFRKSEYGSKEVVLAKVSGALKREIIIFPFKINRKDKFTQHINDIAKQKNIMIIVSDMETINGNSIRMNVYSADNKEKIESLFPSVRVDCRQYKTCVSKLSEVISYIAGHHYIMHVSKHPKSSLRGSYVSRRSDYSVPCQRIQKILEEAYK